MRRTVPQLGNTSRRTIPSLMRAGVKAGELGRPVVLDPVGVGASALRLRTAQELMARMRECIERDRGTTPEGIPYVPLSMAENESYKPQTGCATIARVAFHGEFEPDDRIVTDLLRLIDACDDREGIPRVHRMAV